MMAENLQNQRVVILGGSSGIGLAVAEQAVEQGAQVVIGSSNAKRVEQAAAGLGKGATGRQVDVADESAIRQFFAAVGAFDHLVYTAGDSLQLNTLASTDLASARQTFELRYWGALAAAKYAAPQIRPSGSIVLTTGIAANRPQKGWIFGASVTSAVEGMTRGLAVELAPIRVNAVSPGVVRTNLWQNMTEEQREGMYANIGRQLLVGREGEASDVARAYLFLIQQPFATGQVYIVDGGAVLV